jgi:hypothetical protein
MIDGPTRETDSWQHVQTKRCLGRCLFATLACVVIASGCGDGREKQVNVTGTVFYQGKPIEGARVTFHRAGGRPASGVTDTEGRFALRTYDPDDGAVIGLHAVAIGKSQVNPKYDLTNPEKMFMDLLPLHYAQPHTSELTADVTADGENDFRFDLSD